MDFTKYLDLVKKVRALTGGLSPEARSAALSMLTEGLAGDLGGVQYHLGVLLTATSGHRHPVGAAPAADPGLAGQWDALEARCHEHATQTRAAGPNAVAAAAAAPGGIAEWLPVILQVIQLIANRKK